MRVFGRSAPSLALILAGVILGTLTSLREPVAYPLFPASHGADCVACHDEKPAELEETTLLSQRGCTLHCNSCHVNQTGGGLRTEEGRYFSKHKGATFQLDKDLAFDRVRERWARWFRFGLDIRNAYFKRQGEAARRFFMQADAYVALTPLRHLTLYYQDGITPVDIPSSKEAFLMVDHLPFQSYVKVGRFLPPFGLRAPDHSSFIRGVRDQGMGLGPWDYVEGVEIGINPLIPFLNVAYIDRMENATFGTNASGFAGQLGGKALHRASGMTFGGGVSFLSVTADERETSMWGASGFLHVWRLTGLFEVDRRASDELLLGRTIDSNAAFGQLNLAVYRGLDLLAQYDFWDPNEEVAGDALERLSFGFRWHMIDTVEMDLRYRLERETPAIDNDSLMLQLHYWL